jgi:hypothetical protein
MRIPAALVAAAAVAVALCADSATALGRTPFVTFEPAPGDLVLAAAGAAAPLYVDGRELPAVLRAAADLQADIERVTGLRPELLTDGAPAGGTVVLVGTLGHSALLEGLAAAGKIDPSGIAGAWEGWSIQAVAEPMPGVDQALVIAGSDRRGTIFGIYELAEQIGVSPWYWWADVPTERHEALAIVAGTRVADRPAVRYRGIFLNDEVPALAGWAEERFGGFNHRFYRRVFELILRLRGNFLWPAMWGRAFADDDPLNPVVADEYGIVMGTSHHEPMQRAHVEWSRYGNGPWDYATNAAALRDFWREGFERTRQYENVVTLGMRGDGDEPMSERENVSLLERIVADQRRIIVESSGGRPLEEVAQVWTLYKEVQGYYERGMRVPEDVTLLWSDDNWGNLRRLPTAEERRRPGGVGIYYHLDYVGGPRSYKWLNVTPISKIQQQMNLAWSYGARRIWMVNVGDLKPMEFPVEFFLTLAWAPERWPHHRLGEYGRLWAEREFGGEHAAEIAELVAAYSKFNRRRTPELLSPETYSLVNYREAERVVAAYDELAERAERLRPQLPDEHRDAFFQLVYWPIKACANLNELYVAAGRNRLYGAQGRAETNLLAERVRELFAADAELARLYNHELAGGKWNHFADQPHIGYTSWQQPPRQAMPAVTEIQVSKVAALGVAVEGKREHWGPGNRGPGLAELPPMDAYGRQSRRIEVFNRGAEPFRFVATASVPWLRLEPAAGTVGPRTAEVTVSVDWRSAPHGRHRPVVEIRDERRGVVVVQVPVFHPAAPARGQIDGFVESDGHVSIEAAHFSRAVQSQGVTWTALEGFGRTLSAVTPHPVTAGSRQPAGDSPRLEYDMHLFTTGEIEVNLITAPTLAFVPGRPLRAAVSFDDAPPRIVEIHADPADVEGWQRTVADSARQTITRHPIAAPGQHVLKVWMIDPGLVLQKIVVDLGGVRPSYLGPPETFNGIAAASAE